VPYTRQEAPLAHNKIDAIDTTPNPPDSPFTHFTHCWMAFNDIYGIVTHQTLANLPNASRQLRSERSQLDRVRPLFTQQLKDDILGDSAFCFFLNRTPQWNGQPVPADANGVTPNGVINLNESRYSANIVIAQIDRPRYRGWTATPQAGADCEALIDQIFKVLYTVRCNTFHGGKDTTDDNAIEVVNNAYVLVRKIVDSFLTR
jgi:hypothetical protein